MPNISGLDSGVFALASRYRDWYNATTMAFYKHILIASLLLMSAASGQMVYTKCCMTDPPPCLWIECIFGPDHFIGHRRGGCRPPEKSCGGGDYCGLDPQEIFRSSCVLGFADTLYSVELMANMCRADTFLPDQSTSSCSVWRNDNIPIGFLCWGSGAGSGANCHDLFDLDDDLDVDLRDFALYQNDFNGFP